MTQRTKSPGKREIPRSRRKRLFGVKDSLLSRMTVYLNPYEETQESLSVEDAALYDVVNRIFNKRES